MDELHLVKIPIQWQVISNAQQPGACKVPRQTRNRVGCLIPPSPSLLSPFLPYYPAIHAESLATWILTDINWCSNLALLPIDLWQQNSFPSSRHVWKLHVRPQPLTHAHFLLDFTWAIKGIRSRSGGQELSQWGCQRPGSSKDYAPFVRIREGPGSVLLSWYPAFICTWCTLWRDWTQGIYIYISFPSLSFLLF